MKKILCMLLSLIMLLVLSGCGNDSEINPSKSSSASDNKTANTEVLDVDLTTLSGTMVYSEVYNMMSNPEDYLGKKVKMSGSFGVYQDPNTGKYYFACIIADATACCSQGIEFVLDGDYSYPEDYPEVNSVITVTGTFDTYEENGYSYCQLVNAKML